ncbi:MAG: Fic family protein [Candidatus Eisenbacteria bacterium]|uniref:Fic family protein n=1 Tax=Eiseniibacteriota bacterium TaxID=2212470 RepID=A0A948S0R8_UNCEI|nr:Fic family protein [Candidatus Eisenbacteria bacterium]MBU1950322.1 Fic family protein [Candidatus Eisenbacteria bacterium]MBU2693182.1 Fic family protein [Candidatus Eisenbacteria bacterium]
MTWSSEAVQSGEYHVLLVVAVFVVRFLAIHPFQDGNGRLSRALTTLLLLRAGYDYVPYSSLERIVEDNKEEYYKALRRAQSTLDQGEATALIGANRNMIKDHLARLVEAGYLARKGRGRGSWYEKV